MKVYVYEGGPNMILDQSGREYNKQDGVSGIGASFRAKLDSEGRKYFDLPPVMFRSLIMSQRDGLAWRQANPAACSELAKISLPIL